MSDVCGRTAGAGWCVWAAGAALVGGTAPAARAELVFTTSYGIPFSTIGDVGNPVVPPEVGPRLYLATPPTLIGSVDYEFRIARTEVTVEQWHEFITAYRPFYTATNPNNLPFTGTRIGWSSSLQQYVYDPQNARVAADPSWRVAAAYCNWLHNDKVNEAWAFATGAYDTSTFTTNPDGTVNDQAEHSPGARFWIPTIDEWTKAMYWDPDRYGLGEGGYWRYPHGSDEPPISGVPGVGQTSGGLSAFGPLYPVASYPDVQSPWGLWDGSGSEREWTEWLTESRRRMTKGSEPGLSPTGLDSVDQINGTSPSNFAIGFRIAASVPVPAPASITIVAIAFGMHIARRRES